MRNNNLQSKFWRTAYERLPAGTRGQYAGYFEQAERWELALDALIEGAGRLKTMLHFSHPRSA